MSADEKETTATIAYREFVKLDEKNEQRKRCQCGEHEALPIEGLTQYAVCKHCRCLFVARKA